MYGPKVQNPRQTCMEIRKHTLTIEKLDPPCVQTA